MQNKIHVLFSNRRGEMAPLSIFFCEDRLKLLLTETGEERAEDRTLSFADSDEVRAVEAFDKTLSLDDLEAFDKTLSLDERQLGAGGVGRCRRSLDLRPARTAESSFGLFWAGESFASRTFSLDDFRLDGRW